MHSERYTSKDRSALLHLALTMAFVLLLALVTPVFAKNGTTSKQRAANNSSTQQVQADDADSQQGTKSNANSQQKSQSSTNAQKKSQSGTNAQQGTKDNASTQTKNNNKAKSAPKKRKAKNKSTNPYAQMWKDAGDTIYNKLYPVEPMEGIVNGLSADVVNRVLDAGDKTYHAGLMTYAQGRQIPLEYIIRDPQIFGPWDAYKDHFAEDADPNGLMTEWQKNYYITHDWSDYGKQILTIVPGDQVVINGRTMQVHNMFDYPKVSFSDEIWELVGYSSVVIQTCDPSDENLNRIVYGYWLNGEDEEEEEEQTQAQPQRRSEIEGNLIEQTEEPQQPEQAEQQAI